MSATQASVSGNKAAFQELFRRRTGFSGGLEDFRYSRENNRYTLSLDGHLLPGDDDYRFAGRWNHTSGLYSNFGYNEYTTYYNGTGRTFLPTGTFFNLYDPGLATKRDQLWLEIGLAKEDRPKILLRYERHGRRGTKSSTELGETNLTGGAGSKAIVPASLSMDEIRQILVAEISRSVGPQRWEIAARYERSEQDNRRYSARRPGEAAAERVSTTREVVDSDLFSSHAIVEHEFNQNFRVSAGGLYSSIDTALEGNRIFGAANDAIYDPVFARRQAGDIGYLGLDGSTHLKQYVGNLNAVYVPFKNWTTRADLRYQHLHQDTLSTFVATNVQNNLVTSAIDTGATSEKQEDQLTGTLDVRYTGLPSWTYNLRGEWRSALGDLDEMLYPTATGVPSIQRSTDYARHFEKYALSANWYARPKLTFASEYFFRVQDNYYKAPIDSTLPGTADRYPAFVRNHRFDLHDFNLRASWRAHATLSLVTRYDAQFGRSFARFDGIPATQSGRYTGHIISQSVNWSPVPRLFFTGSGSLVYDQLATPAASIVLNSDNNYFNASFSVGYALTKTSDVYADYSLYHANGFNDNSGTSQPYGSQQKTDNASLTYTVKPSERVRFTLKYTYASNRDKTFAGRNDFHAHIVYAKIQYQL
ncbi:MAG: hypothetical protein QM715_15625 [Nibricoccus sp.]